MVNITEFALKNSRLTIMALFMMVLMGVIVFLSYPSREDPSITIRIANITTQFPGMSPERIEDLITRPIEEKLREISEVKSITSDSKTGVSLVKVELKDSIKDLAPVWQDLREKMKDIGPSLPEGVRGPFINDNVGLTAMASIALWSDGFSLAEMNETAKDIRNHLYALDGIQKIDLFGVQDERIFLELSRTAITQYGIDPSVIIDTLKKQNVILPGGQIDADGQTVILEPTGNFNSVEDIKKLIIAIPNSNQMARLSDIVNISRAYIDPPQAPVYFNGKPAIVISISAADGLNSEQFGRLLKDKVTALQNQLPWGYKMEFATFQPDLVKVAVDGAINNLYQTLGIVLLVVMAFLGLRTGLIVGSFVPLTMLAGLVIMRGLDVELQRVSISAMIISLGMLVDNGIVMAEDVRVRMEQGVERIQAAIASGKSLAVPLLTSSLTTILFFVPMALAEGGTGEFTGSLAIVVTILLLTSWFLALYMTPAICAWFLKVKVTNTDTAKRFDSKLYVQYRGILQSILKFRVPFLGLMVVLLFGSAFAMKFVDSEFFPLGDRNQYLIYMDLPAGSSIKKTDEAVQRLSLWLSDETINPEISSSVAYVAGGGPRFYLALSQPDPDPHKAFILVNLKSASTADDMIIRTRSHLLNTFPGVQGEVKKMWMGASEPGLFQIRLIGPDKDVLLETSEQLIGTLKKLGGMLSAKQDWENPILKLTVDIDQARARTAGVSSEQVANTLNTYLTGRSVTDFREGNKVIPVILRGVEEDRATLTGLQGLSVYSKQHSTWIPVTQIADISGQWQPGRIKRYQQERTLTISAKHIQLSASEVYAQLIPALEALNLPAGHHWEIGGEIEDQADANGNLFAALPACLGLIVVLLVWQFNSFRRPAIILLTIPLVLIGATAGLLAMNASFGFMVMLGFFSLAGIIINNGIVLIDRIDQEQKTGLSPYEAIMTACLSRLRPILITTLTTVLGLLPLIISKDPLFYGMASAIAFGLAIGTVFTLGVVPALYALFFRVHSPTS